MKHDHFVVRSPDKPTQQLLLLFHGIDDNPVAMGEVGTWFAPLFPDALIVSIGGAESYGTTSGRQWFSMQDVTEESHQACTDAIMPVFIETVRCWQKHSGVPPQVAILVGFSQGATISLESIKAEPGLASRVIAFDGRYATLPETATTATTVRLVHGGEDWVIELSHAVAAQEALMRADGDVTLGIVENLGHTINERGMQFALDHLRFTVPKHYFDEASSGSKPRDDGVVAIIQLITVDRIKREALPSGA